MSAPLIDIKAESFPWQAKLIGVLLTIVAVAVVGTFWYLSVGLFAIAVFLLTTYSGTEIDPEQRTYKEYNSYFFVKSGDSVSYSAVEKIYINSAKESQTMHPAHTLDSRTFETTVYNAYLKFEDGTKIFLTSRKNKKNLIQLLDPIARKLDVQLVDNTNPH